MVYKSILTPLKNNPPCSEDQTMSETNFFKSELRELEFVLYEHFKLGELFTSAPFDHMDDEDAKMILTEANHFATEVIGPTNMLLDKKGVDWTPEGVKVPEELKNLWNQYYEGGWNMLTISEEKGGQGAPSMLGTAVSELINGANTAFSMYPGLTGGAAAVIRAVGSDEQRGTFLEKMENGTWGGTMCLTEPNAGSDVGLGTTKAKDNSDGTFNITGTKIFISSGDHDMAENIIHLVLARIEGAPKGTRGLSLFIVPRNKINPDGTSGESNDVTCTGVEEKMGIHASATASLSFGDNGNCIGYPVGGPKKEEGPGGAGDGMKKMFIMMNGARIGVGIQSLAVASTAYLNAVTYARTRLQGADFKEGRPENGAVPIIRHPDVRRMLMDMKSNLEGCRALMYFAVNMQDRSAALRESDPEASKELQDYFGLFTPMVKGYISDMALQITSTAMQVFGGAGYTGDYPAEQYMRDSRIFPIYEGTNGIQSMDLVGRKLMANSGAQVGRFVEEASGVAASTEKLGGFTKEASVFKESLEAFNQVVGKYGEFFTSGRMDLILVTSTRFMEAMSKITVARLLLEQAMIADEKLKTVEPDTQDFHFYQGKIASARYFVLNTLPSAKMLCEVIMNGDDSPMTISDSGFSLAW